MKRSQWILRVILVGALVSPGCGGGPTSSIGNGNGGGGTGPGGGSPADLNLTGTWTGTIQFYMGNCPIEPVSVVLTQAEAGVNGTHFSGQFDSPCAGPIQINGILSAGRLYGSVTDANGNGRITGTASATEIKISTTQGAGGLDGGQEAVNSILLHR
jgi:hypothetical protein